VTDKRPDGPDLGVHGRDLTLENVMIDSDGRCQIIDLGLCVQSQGGGEARGGRCPLAYAKPLYIAPETATQAESDGHAVDCWSLGVMLYVMLTSRPIYASMEDPAFQLLAEGQAETVLEHYESYGLVISPMAKQLICSLLQADPDRRMTLEQIAAHPWVRHQALAPTPPPPPQRPEGAAGAQRGRGEKRGRDGWHARPKAVKKYTIPDLKFSCGMREAGWPVSLAPPPRLDVDVSLLTSA
jgi:serine/threonine protein kinase